MGKEAEKLRVNWLLVAPFILNMFYRDDIGDRWNEDSDKLHN